MNGGDKQMTEYPKKISKAEIIQSIGTLGFSAIIIGLASYEWGYISGVSNYSSTKIAGNYHVNASIGSLIEREMFRKNLLDQPEIIYRAESLTRRTLLLEALNINDMKLGVEDLGKSCPDVSWLNVDFGDGVIRNIGRVENSTCLQNLPS